MAMDSFFLMGARPLVEASPSMKLHELLGWGANDQRVQAWLSDHDEPKEIDEKQTTGPDGAFEFRRTASRLEEMQSADYLDGH